MTSTCKGCKRSLALSAGVIGSLLLSARCQAFLSSPKSLSVSPFAVNRAAADGLLSQTRGVFVASTMDAPSANQDRPHCTNMNTRPPVACLCGVRACSRHARVIVAAANADTAAVGDNAEGGGARTETEMTKEELQARINKQIAETNSIVGTKLMTISSFGPDNAQTWSSSGKKNRKVNNSSSISAASIPEDILPQVMARQAKLFEKRKWRLIGDNVFLGLLGASAAWCISLKAACSYGLGATLGTAYLVLLSRFVESVGKEGAGSGRGGGGGGGPARLALAGLLVLIVAKNKEVFDLVPALSGFLAYQVSTLVQGIYTDFDELEDAEAAG